MTLRHDCFESQTNSVLLLTVIGQRHVTPQAHKQWRRSIELHAFKRQ
jgi:hypothetical protein